MKKLPLLRIAVLTENEYLYRKIELECADFADVNRASNEHRQTEYDILLVDTDTKNIPDGVSAITMSRKFNSDIPLPFPIGSLASRFCEKKDDTKPLCLSDEDKTVTLHGKKAKLTDVEYSLFSVLYEKKGGYTSRDELLSRVWNNSCDSGIINVYIHYIREKLEKHGEKVIISSRKQGYKIDERFFGGYEDA